MKLTKSPNAAIPTLPDLTPNGSYDPTGLVKYLDECTHLKVSFERVADHLGVPLHRVIYACGVGRDAFKRRSAKASKAIIDRART